MALLASFAALSTVFAALTAGTAPEQGNHKVVVQGKTYRVKVRGDAVGIFEKSIVTARSPERGELMRQALKQATGCGIRNEYWEGAHLVGMLDCPADAAPSQGPGDAK